MKQLLLKNEIDGLTDTILGEVENLTNMKGMEDVFSYKDSDRRRIGRTQLSSLLQNCRNASSAEELKLFISYKEAKENGWDIRIQGRSIAQRLIDSIIRVEGLSSDVINAVNSKLPEDEKILEDDRRKIKLMLVEKFLGYLYWKGTTMAN